MTVNISTTRIAYACNGILTEFEFPFKIIENADILALKTIDDTGVESILTLDIDYEITISETADGGVLTLLDATTCPDGTTLTILRDVDILQETDFVDGEGFSAESVEAAIDKDVTILQQFDDDLSRAIRFPQSTSNTGSRIDSAEFLNRASKILGFNSLGTLGLFPNTIAASALASGAYVDIADYGYDLTALVAALGATVTDVLIDGAAFCSGNTVVPSTLRLLPTIKATIDQDVYTLSIAGEFTVGLRQIFIGSGTVSGFKKVYPEWWESDGTAIPKAVATGAEVILHQGSYDLSSAITLASGQVIRGAGKTATTINKAFNGDAITMGDGSGLIDLTLDGNGATYTGRNIVISGTDGRQYGRDCRIIDSNGYAIEYTGKDSGSQDSWIGCHISRYDGLTAGKYAVKIADTAPGDGQPHKYVNIETDGYLFMDVGNGSVFVTNSYVGAFKFSANTTLVEISNTRIRGSLGETMTINGSGINIDGCSIYPEVILASGANYINLCGVIYNNGLTDNSGEVTNSYDVVLEAYNPVWSTDGVAPDIGDGTITGTYQRIGYKNIVNIDVTFGSTTTFGTGVYSFSIPKTPVSAISQWGTVRMIDSSTGFSAAGRFLVSPGVDPQIQYDAIITDDSPVTAVPPGTVQHNAPWTWADGDTISITVEYTD